MIPEGAITNSAGQVAIKWVLLRPPKTVKIDGTDRYYVFVFRSHVAMSWVNEEDVQALLSFREKTCNCSHGIYKNAFALANELDVCLWMTGERCNGGEVW